MDFQKFSVVGFTTQTRVLGQGFTAAVFVQPVPYQNFVQFQVPRNDVFLVPVPQSGTLTLAELTAAAGATAACALATLPLYTFYGAPRFALASTGATAVVSCLFGLSTLGATFTSP